MNPILILYIVLATFFVWLLSSWAFHGIGDAIKTIIKWFKEDEEDENE